MKKIILLIFVFFTIFFYSNEISKSILISFDLCINKLFPSFIPFMFLSSFLINYNFIPIISYFINPLMGFFKVSKSCSYVFIMSILSGSPAVAIYLNELYNNNLISIEDINKCLKFCHFTNPLFIINTIGIQFLNNKILGIIILLSQYISSFILGIIYRNDFTLIIDSKHDINNKKIDFINLLKISIYDIIDKLLLMLGIITFFLIITTLLKLNNNPVSSILEITQGLNIIKNLNISFELKAILSSGIISFGGLSIHAQVFSIIENKKIRYLPYLKSRILHFIISIILCFIFINLLY